MVSLSEEYLRHAVWRAVRARVIESDPHVLMIGYCMVKDGPAGRRPARPVRWRKCAEFFTRGVVEAQHVVGRGRWIAEVGNRDLSTAPPLPLELPVLELE